MNSRGRNSQKRQFFAQCNARAQAYAKKKKDIAMAKAGQVLPDPETVEVSEGEVLPDPDVVEEG